MAREPRHIIIVGAGIVGLSAAYYLSRRGERVTVFDNGDITTGASAGNAGVLALGHPPLPRPGLTGQAIRWMLDPASPLYVKWRIDPALLAWMWGFRRACGEAPFARGQELMARLGPEAGACFDRIIEDESIECDYQKRGWLELYRTPRGRAAGNREIERLRPLGYRIDTLSQDELRQREPAVGPAVVGAAHYRDSSFLDPGSFLRQFAAAVQRHGATVTLGTGISRFLTDRHEVVGVLTERGERVKGDTVLLAAGSWSTELASSVGVHVPMQPGKGYHVKVALPDPPVTNAAVLAERHIAVNPAGNKLLLAGTVELSGLNLILRRRRVEMLTEGAAEYFPSIDPSTCTVAWCGLRPCTADGLPVIGWAPQREHLFIATGHAKMGMTLGPLTGKLISEWILDGRPSLDVSAMSPARFAGRQESRVAHSF